MNLQKETPGLKEFSKLLANNIDSAFASTKAMESLSAMNDFVNAGLKKVGLGTISFY